MMYELIYHSTASRGFDINSLRDILITARIFNSENQITGCLVYHQTEFMQILEGQEEVVKDLYKKLQTDPRHYNLNILSQGPIEERAFADWTMAYYDLSSLISLESSKITVDELLLMTKKMNNGTTAQMLFKYIAEDIFRPR